MSFTTPAPSNKRKKSNKIITDLSNISQNDEVREARERASYRGRSRRSGESGGRTSATNEESDSETPEFDLGTKIKTPKDLMLEELSLLKNKGSKMFKMRQQRVEKFIVTTNLQNLLMSPPPVPPKPELPKEEVKVEVDEEADKERKRKQYVRTYISPWERAMKGNEELTVTMKGVMPGPIQIHPELPHFKSFNRMALPYGGYDKASKMLTFEMPEINVATEEPEPLPTLQADIRSRPSFNRTPIGWICSEDNSHIHLDADMEVDNMAFDGETDDL